MFKNTIIVTANYRLSIFGWLGSDNLRVSRSTHSSHPHSRVHAPTHPRAHTHAKYCARTPLILCFLLEYFSFFLSPPFFVSLFFVSLFSFLFPFLCLFRAFSSSQHTLPPPPPPTREHLAIVCRHRMGRRATLACRTSVQPCNGSVRMQQHSTETRPASLSSASLLVQVPFQSTWLRLDQKDTLTVR